MGSFSIIPIGVTTLAHGDCAFVNTPGWVKNPGCTNTNPDLLDAFENGTLQFLPIRGVGVGSGSIGIFFNLTDALISLDGNPPIAFNALPSGFTLETASLFINSLSVNFTNDGNPASAASYNIAIDFGTRSSLSLIDSFSGSIPLSVNLFSQTLDFDMSFPKPIMLDLMNSQIDYVVSLSSTHPDPNVTGGISFGGATIGGTYSLLSFQWTLDVPTDPVDTGDDVTVTSDPTDPDPLDMTQITSLTIEFLDDNGDPQTIDIPPILWITITVNLFIFRWPSWGSFSPQTVTLTITSTQFSGSVTLGKLITIFFVNATGIYTLDPDAISDTLYDNENGGIIEAKIPNPRFKTGFIGG